MTHLVFDHVEKRFNGTVALRDFNLEVRPGEFMVLVGPSGCGKTTALRIIAGLETPTRGTVRLGERVLNEVPPRDRDVAMVFQNWALYPHFTTFENIAFPLRMRRVRRPDIERRVREAARMLGLEHLLDRRPRQLSGGQQQRVALGRAIVREPQVFLMDEPLSNLDAKLRLEMRAELIKLHRRLGVTTVYVTHDQTEAMTMAQRLAVMCDGELLQVDTPQAVYDCPQTVFVAQFIGTPPMNLLRARVRADGEYLTLVADSWQVPLPADRAAPVRAYQSNEVLVGVRAEDLRRAPQTAANGLPARVELTEALGSYVLAHAIVGDTSVVAAFEPADAPAEGDTLHLAPDPARLHLFDPATDQRIA